MVPEGPLSLPQFGRGGGVGGGVGVVGVEDGLLVVVGMVGSGVGVVGGWVGKGAVVPKNR